MRLVLIISFLASLLFANETRLVIGCFKEPKNAQNAKMTIDKYIQDHQEFKNFLDKNSVSTKYTKIGSWNVISFEPFVDSTPLFATYFKIKDMYPDAYKVAINAQDEEQVIASNYMQESDSVKKDEMKHSSASEDKKIMTFQNEMTQKTADNTVPDMSNEAVPEMGDSVKPDDSQKKLKQEITRDSLPSAKKESSSSDFNYLYPLLAAVLIAIILIIYFTQRKPKKTLHTIEDDFKRRFIVR